MDKYCDTAKKLKLLIIKIKMININKLLLINPKSNFLNFSMKKSNFKQLYICIYTNIKQKQFKKLLNIIAFELLQYFNTTDIPGGNLYIVSVSV